jgi:ribulose-phosphate 3-epimerase
MPPNEKFLKLRASLPAVLPSLLMCDFGHLADEIARLEAVGAQALHLDVMDGHFVPNLTYGLPLVETVRRLTNLAIEVHLMITEPEKWVGRYLDAGADIATFHIEATDDAGAVLNDIRRRGGAAGLALNPPTPLSKIEPLLPLCDVVLVMSVMPGFGGQNFDPVALEKLNALRARPDLQAMLEIDGGVNAKTLPLAVAAGGQSFVIGSAIFQADDYGVALENLTQMARGDAKAAR